MEFAATKWSGYDQCRWTLKGTEQKWEGWTAQSVHIDTKVNSTIDLEGTTTKGVKNCS